MGYRSRWEEGWYRSLSMGEQRLYDYAYEHGDSDGIWRVDREVMGEYLGGEKGEESIKRVYSGRVIPGRGGKIWYLEEKGEGSRVLIAEASEAGKKRRERVSHLLGYGEEELREEIRKYWGEEEWFHISVDVNLGDGKINLVIMGGGIEKKAIIREEISESVLSKVLKDVTKDVLKGVDKERKEKEAMILYNIGLRGGTIIESLKTYLKDKRKRSPEKEIARKPAEIAEKLVMGASQEKEKKSGEELSMAIRAEGKGFAEWFITLLPKSRKVSKNDLIGWAGVYEKLRGMGKSKSEIVAVTRWARQDSFWEKNFLSAKKLIRRNSEGVYYYDVFLAHRNSSSVRGGGYKELPPAKSEKLHKLSEAEKERMLKVLGGDKRKA